MFFPEWCEVSKCCVLDPQERLKPSEAGYLFHSSVIFFGSIYLGNEILEKMPTNPIRYSRG